MKTFDTIGSSPIDENCAQVGSEGYMERANKECHAFINQLVREVGTPPEGASLTIRTFQHDFGPYLEVVCNYDDESQVESEYNLDCMNNPPAKWDEAAITELSSETPIRQKEPSIEQLEQWMFDGGCEATDGCSVEADGVCPHGCKSWLLEMGII